jgi:putative Ca2+/H+ antiporter (TMEM165/GDT1 family)
LVAFTTIFLSEWGDKGMTTAGVWAAANVSVAPGRGRTHRTAALIVWMAAVGAMVTKGGLAVTLGSSIRGWIAAHISPRRVRHLAVSALVALGILSVLEVTGILVD